MGALLFAVHGLAQVAAGRARPIDILAQLGGYEPGQGHLMECLHILAIAGAEKFTRQAP